MSTSKIFFLRPCPIWNLMIRSEQTIEIEDWIAKALIERGVAEDADLRKKRLAAKKRKEKADE